MSEEMGHNEQVLDQFSRQAERYGKLTSALGGEKQRAAFAALVGARESDFALDVCCGSGTLALGLAPCVGRVTGLDLTPAMLDQARAAQIACGATNVDWVQGDALDMPFTDHSFSLVTCSAAFHHMREPRRVLAEMIRVCRPKGRVVVRDVTPDASTVAAYDQMEKLRDPSHCHALTSEELARLGTGLDVERPELHASVTADLLLDSILATSFPQECSIADLRTMFEEDAREGADRLGFNARFVDGELRVSYRQTTAVWVRK